MITDPYADIRARLAAAEEGDFGIEPDALAALTDHAPADLARLLAEIQRVRALHAFVPAVLGIHSDGCRACQRPYPCPTIRALDGDAATDVRT